MLNQLFVTSNLLINFALFVMKKNLISAHGGGRVVSASGSETSVSSSTPTSANIYDEYTSIKKKSNFYNSKNKV